MNGNATRFMAAATIVFGLAMPPGNASAESDSPRQLSAEW